jgi:glycosyltransferase involved in cell wall biosynthesis
MATGRTPRIVGVSYGAPFDRLTKSGTAFHLFSALRDRGVLEGAVNARPPWFDYVEKAGSFVPGREVWKQRYHASSSPVSPAVKWGMSRLGARRAARVDPAPDALLQVSTWVDLTWKDDLRPRLRCCYLDGNVAAWLTRPDLAIDPDGPHVRRTLAFERRVFDGMDLIMSKSEWARRSFIADYGQDPGKVVAIGNGANLPRVPETTPERDLARPRLLFLGKNFARKGGDDLLAAFARVREARPDAELWVVGPSSPDPGIPGVRWIGHISRADPDGDDRIDEIYRSATAFVMPTLYEGFGIPYLEAMAYRLPCIGSDVCAIPEIIEEGVTGYLTPLHDPETLAARMLAVVSDPDRARAMGEAGYERFRSRFTWARVAERIEEEVSSRLDALGARAGVQRV